jgi:plasmid stabilization system protein ParE
VIPVRFRKSAQADVQQAYEFFESRTGGLGAEFLKRVEEASDLISRNPEAYQTVFQDVRRVSLKQFKYALFYRIETDGSVVIACLAHRRDLSLARRRALRPVEPA